MLRVVLMWLAVLLLVLAAHALALLGVHAAPVPPAKVITRPPLVGSWLARWGSCDYHCAFGRDGSWHAMRGASRWSGRWSLVGDVLTIHEALEHEDGSKGALSLYRFRLKPGRLTGRTEYDEHLSLRKED